MAKSQDKLKACIVNIKNLLSDAGERETYTFSELSTMSLIFLFRLKKMDKENKWVVLLWYTLWHIVHCIAINRQHQPNNITELVPMANITRSNISDTSMSWQFTWIFNIRSFIYVSLCTGWYGRLIVTHSINRKDHRLVKVKISTDSTKKKNV